jgi:hypothetical protein
MGNIFAVLGSLTRASTARGFVSLLDSADTVSFLSGGTNQLAYSRLWTDKWSLNSRVG